MPETADSESDELLDDVSLALDTAEQRLRQEGYLLPLQTGNALLGALVLPEGETEAAAVEAEVRAIAGELAEALAGRPGAHPDVHVNVCFHVAGALVTDSSEAPGGKEIVGGELTAIADWAPQENVAGLFVV